MKTNGFIGNLRIISAIAMKDIVDALMNKKIMSSVFSSILLVVFFRFLPVIEGGDVLPRLAVYDAGESAVITQLEQSLEFDFYEFASQEQVEDYVADRDVVVIGVVLPGNFDTPINSESQIELDAYVAHWPSDTDIQESVLFFEDQLSVITGKEITVNIEDHTVYTRPSSRGPAFYSSVSFVLIFMLVGLSVIPNLMIDERKNKTMDALMVSPASNTQIVIGKAIAGLVYCLFGLVVMVLVYSALITQWWLAILVIVVGSLFAVSLGLLLGSLVEVRQQLLLWTFIILVPLLVPVFFVTATKLFSDRLISIMAWIPTVVLVNLLKLSYMNQAPLADLLPRLGFVIGITALIFGLVVWVVRRQDQ